MTTDNGPAYDDELETAAPGTTMNLTETGWERCAYVAPGDDWLVREDGSFVSPDERVRTWPYADPS